jgi:anti-sigma factor RsiW
MNEIQNSPGCERASDLIAFLYGEADEHEARDFQRHLQQCSSCRDEVASFGNVRESITAWRDEALAGFVSRPAQPRAKSALAALRQFFDLSPLWLKGVTALAAVTLCVLAGFALFRSNNNQISSSNAKPGAVYTEQDVNRLVKEALAQQATVNKPPVETPSPETVAVNSPKPKPKSSRATSSTQSARSQRPLSKVEREQLAAELRLLSSDDDPTLHLLGDRINQ